MPASRRLILNPQKLLLSKWTAVTPRNKEKHFLVMQLLLPEVADAPIELIELQAIYNRRSRIMPWRELTDSSLWLPGWR